MADSVGADIGKCAAFWTRCKLVSLGLLALVATVVVVGQSSETIAASQGKSKLGVLPGVVAVQSAIVSAEKAETLNQNLVSQLGSEAVPGLSILVLGNPVNPMILPQRARAPMAIRAHQRSWFCTATPT